MYNESHAGALDLVCSLANRALDELVPSEVGWYGERTYTEVKDE